MVAQRARVAGIARAGRVLPASLLAASMSLANPAAATPRLVVDSAAFGNVFTSDEPPVLTLTVRTDPDRGVRGRLLVRAVDAYGRLAYRRATTVAAEPGGAAAVDVALPPGRLGHYAVQAKLLVDGRRAAETATAAAVVPPVIDTDADESAVGYFVFPDDPDLPRAMGIAGQMRRLGIRWVRMQFRWNADERRERPDLSDPAWLDSAAFETWVDAFRANGIEVVGTLFGTARWASSAPEDELPLAGLPRWALVAPADLADWDLAVRTLAQRVRARVRNWEIWNEPDIPVFWQSSAREFVDLTRVTAAALREVDPTVRVILNFVPPERGHNEEFESTVLPEVAPLLDVFGYHYGSRRLGALAWLVVPLMRPGATVWNTEAHGPPRRNVSRWLDERAGGVERLFSFIYHRPVDDAALEYGRFGLFPVNVDFTPRPDAVVLRTLSDVVGSATAAGFSEAGLGWMAYPYATPGGQVVALADANQIGVTWSPRRGVILQVEVPGDVRTVDVIDLMGNRETIRVRRGRLRLRMLGVGGFLRADPPEALTGVRVVRSRRARR